MYEQLLKRLMDAIDQREKAVARGAAKDWSEYKSMTGEIKGLRVAIQEIRDLLSRYEED